MAKEVWQMKWTSEDDNRSFPDYRRVNSSAPPRRWVLCTEFQRPNLIFHPSVLEMNEANGSVKLTCLGSDIIRENELLQYTVPPNVWFGAFPTKDINISKTNEADKNVTRDDENHFSLVGCNCASAFEFADFELAKHS